MHRIRDLWRHNRLALIACLLAVCLTAFFGVRSVRQLIYWADPAHQDQTLAGWMTPRYVARSYDVPPEVIQAALSIDPQGAPFRHTLDQIAAEEDVALAQLQAQVDAAVAAWRAANPGPAP